MHRNLFGVFNMVDKKRGNLAQEPLLCLQHVEDQERVNCAQKRVWHP